MFEFSVGKDMKKIDIIREVAVVKVAAHLSQTMVVRVLKVRVEQGRVGW
jgi:hypothetical protein